MQKTFSKRKLQFTNVCNLCNAVETIMVKASDIKVAHKNYISIKDVFNTTFEYARLPQ